MPLTLATFNALDLFDEAPTEKIRTLATWLRHTEADIVALQEVSSEAIVRTLFREVGQGHEHVVVGTADKRGICCAIASRFPIRAAEVITAADCGFPIFQMGDAPPFPGRIPLRRGIPVAHIATPIGECVVLALHFKSRRGVALRGLLGDEVWVQGQAARAEEAVRSLILRSGEALFVRRVVDHLLAENPQRHLAVCGDFNDTLDGTPVRIVAGWGEAGLHSAGARVEGGFSVLHNGVRATIDHVLVSRSLAERIESVRFFNENLRNHDALPEEEIPMDSDHAPLAVRFSEQPPAPPAEQGE